MGMLAGRAWKSPQDWGWGPGLGLAWAGRSQDQGRDRGLVLIVSAAPWWQQGSGGKGDVRVGLSDQGLKGFV